MMQFDSIFGHKFVTIQAFKRWSRILFLKNINKSKFGRLKNITKCRTNGHGYTRVSLLLHKLIGFFWLFSFVYINAYHARFLGFLERELADLCDKQLVYCHNQK